MSDGSWDGMSVDRRPLVPVGEPSGRREETICEIWSAVVGNFSSLICDPRSTRRRLVL